MFDVFIRTIMDESLPALIQLERKRLKKDYSIAELETLTWTLRNQHLENHLEFKHDPRVIHFFNGVLKSLKKNVETIEDLRGAIVVELENLESVLLGKGDDARAWEFCLTLHDEALRQSPRSRRGLAA